MAARIPVAKSELGVLDTLDWRIDFIRVPYHAAATEATAAVFGYRITPWNDRLYSFRRRLTKALRLPSIRTSRAPGQVRTALNESSYPARNSFDLPQIDIWLTAASCRHEYPRPGRSCFGVRVP